EPHLARYQLTGAVRGSGAQTRLLFRLADTGSGRQLWAHRADGLVCGDPAAEENLATRIAAALQPCLRSGEIEHALQKPRDELSAHALARRARPGVLAFDAEGNARARDFLEQAIDGDPQQALAVALTAWAHLQRVVYHFPSEPMASRGRGIELTRKAMTLP